MRTVSTAPAPSRPVSAAYPGSLPRRMVGKPKIFPDVFMSLSSPAAGVLVQSVAPMVSMATRVAALLDTAGGYFSIDAPTDMTLDVATSVKAFVTATPAISLPMNPAATYSFGPANYTDDFNRANGPLGPLWQSKNESGTTGNIIVDGTIKSALPSATSGANATNQTVSVFVSPTTTDNMRCQFKTVSAPPAGYFAGVVARSDAGMNNYVVALAAGSAETAGLYTVVDNTFTKRVQFGTSVFAAGDLVILECVGNVYRVIRSRAGVESDVVSWTDSGSTQPRGSSFRYGGCYTVAIRGGGGGGYGQALDDFLLKDI